MKTPPRSDAIFRALTDDAESAAQSVFIELCRAAPAFRHWLWEDFARDAKVRAAVAKIVDESGSAIAPDRRWFAAIADEDRSWRVERDRLQRELPDGARIYGGLSWAEVEALVRHYQAGALDLGTFLLVHDWRRTKSAAARSPALARAAVAFVDSVVCGGQVRLMRHLTKAIRFFEAYDQKSKRRAAIGYSDWWKLHALRFILRHPRPAYRTRELRAHLAALGLDTSAKDIRRFCARHGIRRDMRAGRPRKHA